MRFRASDVAAANAALSLDPSIAEAYCPIVTRLSEQGRTDEAAAAMERALALDPRSWEVRKEAGRLALRRRRVGEEMADVLWFLVRLADRLDIDLLAAAEAKLVANAAKYPADRVRGQAKKYDEY